MRFWLNEPLEQWIYTKYEGKPHKHPWAVCVGGGVASIQARFTTEGEADLLVRRLKAALGDIIIISKEMWSSMAREQKRLREKADRVPDKKTMRHILEALRSFASKKRHGKGCVTSTCGTVCLCGPCHARVALERLDP